MPRPQDLRGGIRDDFCAATARIGLTTIQSPMPIGRRLCSRQCRRHRGLEIGRVDVVLSSNPDQREEGITPSVGRRRLANGADRPVRSDAFPP